ncbi:MAG: histidine kinase dimerization/phospho-acceptor domain-containing protein, partial [Ignavibacteria bacterium]|nr:histidine kinase dimerization/phospho-acceptor domain-containing protein [Ignavibacteria bacterium]
MVLDYKSDIESELYFPPEVFLHNSIESFLPSNLSQRVRTSIEKVKRDRNLVTMEYVIPLGVHRRHFEARFFPLLNNEIIVIIREISDKVIFQEKILEKEKLLLETQRIAKVFSFFYDVQENIITVTDEFKNISEISDLTLENRPEYFLKIIHDEDRESVQKEFSSSFDFKMTDIYLEYRISTPSGAIKYILTEGRVKFDSKGKPTQVLGLSQDITQRKNYEIELLTQRKELQGLLSNIEGIVQTQTLEVVQAKERAEKASQAKSFFLANVSHELKTPIHAIMSFAELGIEKIDTVDKTKVAEYFSIILQSAKRLINLMTNILDLSKLESGNENFRFENTNLYELCIDI